MSRVIFHRREAPDDSGTAQLADEGKIKTSRDSALNMTIVELVSIHCVLFVQIL